ncbi:MAG: class IV adenylate cyclase [Phycisphaerae bacterium]
MALEVEAKLRVSCHDEIRTRLQALGGERVSRVLETNMMLDHPKLDLRGQGCGLRIRAIRKEESECIARVTVTYKGAVRPGRFKIREEVEYNATDPDEVALLYEKLGFETVLLFEKKRETWKLDGCLIELDEPPVIGRFIEIECDDEQQVQSMQEKLGLSGHKHEQVSYAQMLATHCRENNIHPPVVRMPG